MKRLIPRLFLAGAALVAMPGLAGTAPNEMHPPFPVLDAAGQPVRVSGAEASPDRTCGACHDAAFIDSHNPHRRNGREATCLDCHYEGDRLPTAPEAFDDQGMLRREAIRIFAPTDRNCARCHGIVHLDPGPLAIPDDFEAPAPPRTYAMTRDTGAVWSPQDLSKSWINLAGRETLEFPWDVHARRLVGCTSCHFSRNNPAKSGVKQTVLDFLVNDPRRIPWSQYLKRPDHELVTASCRSCHDPGKAHQFLPYKDRHLAVLDCRSCHVPAMRGPAAQAVDATVVLPGGGPRVEYRGVRPGPGESLNAAFSEGYQPFLLERTDPVEGGRLAPFNLVTRWFWVSGSTGEEVPAPLVRAAWLDGDRYDSAVIRALDGNGDGRLDPPEIRLDTPAKVAVVASRLAAAGVPDPQIRAEILPRPVSHGVLSGAQVRRDCGNCHGASSVLDVPIPLASSVPGGVVPGIPDAGAVSLDGTVRSAGDGGLVLHRTAPASLYVFGHSRVSLADRLGLFLFAVVVFGVAIHGGLRILASRRGTNSHAVPGRVVYLYSTYERIWHWLMAFSILTLLLTGFEIHFGDRFVLFGLPVAVKVHNFFAVVMVVNAFLSLFYHLASAAIRQFLPPREDLVGAVTAQARYYLRGIFLGQPHPTPKSRERKLNPLQQVTYLALLNILFPFQVVTGILIWSVSRWPDFAASIGGLRLVAPLHDLGSWLFLAFVVLHVYLTTTGRTVGSNIAAMVTGWEEIDDEKAGSEGGAP